MSAKSAKPTKVRETVFDVDVERLADLYARAGLDAAGDAESQQQLADDLESLVADVLDVHPDFEELCRSKLISRDEKLELLDRVFGASASPTSLNLLKVMVLHGRLGIIRAVARSAHKLINERIGCVLVSVETALPLDADSENELVAILKTRLNAEPIIETHVNPDLLAGLVIRAGDKVFDASARTHLQRARRQMVAHAVETIQARPHQFMDQSTA
jgi:F-type H+-transporting ATPase subunit delta